MGCPPDVQVWPLIVQNLPLREDAEEAKKNHRILVDLVIQENPGLLGGPERTNLGQVLSVLAEVYRVNNLCSKETDEKITQIFRHIPREHLQILASRFTE